MPDMLTVKKVIGSKSKAGGKSKKNAQHAHSMSTGKYKRQALRTAEHKKLAWTKHLVKHPNDKQNKHDIEAARKSA